MFTSYNIMQQCTFNFLSMLEERLLLFLYHIAIDDTVNVYTNLYINIGCII